MGKRVLHEKKLLPYIALWVVFVLVLVGFSVWLGRKTIAVPPAPPPPVVEPEPPVVPEVVEPEPPAVPETPVPSEPDVTTSLVEKYVWGQPVSASEAVGNEYFTECAFVGNSLIEGFQLYSGLKTGDYYTYKGITVSDIGKKQHSTLKNGTKGTILQALAEKQSKKIYIMMGLNEMGYRSYEAFSKLYSELITAIKGSQPDAKIIILSVLPVTRAKSDKDAIFNIKNVGIFQELVRKVAEDNEAYYINLAEVFTDKDGYLPEASSKDGVHLTRENYLKWLDYLKTHTIDKYLEKKQ